MEALKEMDEQIIPWFQSAAAELLKDMPAEKAVALALAKITGNTELKVSTHIASCVITSHHLCHTCIARKEKKRKDFTFLRQFHEPCIMLGLPSTCIAMAVGWDTRAAC